MSTPYQPSAVLQTPHAHTTKSVALGTTPHKSTINPNELRYWSAKYGLGPSNHVPNRKNKNAPRVVKFRGTTTNAIVSQVVFSPKSDASGSLSATSTPRQLAIVSGPRVGLYHGHGNLSHALILSSRPRTKKREVNLFGDRVLAEDDEDEGDDEIKADRYVGTGGTPALCASYRNDGRLIAVGTDNGEVRVCDTTTRATLRTFGGGTGRAKGHAVRGVAWLRNGKRLLSGGDDGVVRVWDLTSDGVANKPTWEMQGHGDAVRCALILSLRMDAKVGKEALVWSQLAVSGSYDHTVRVWDLDSPTLQDRCLSVMDHGAPVETLAIIPSKASEKHDTPLILSAGATTLKIWHPLTGKCLSTVGTMHSKTITSLCVTTVVRDSGGNEDAEDRTKIPEWRVLTAALDGLIRIHQIDKGLTLPCVHGFKTQHPISALGVSPDSRRVVIGTTTGQITVRQRPPIVPHGGLPKKRKRKPEAGTYSYFMRGHDAKADVDDYVVLQEKSKRLKAYDLALRKFWYGEALDEALESRQPQTVAAVLEELGKRRGLSQALSNRDEETLEPLLSFTVRYITRPAYTPLLVGVADMLCDIYGSVAGQSETIDGLFEKLRIHVRGECRAQRTLLKLVGQIDSVMTAAAMQKLQGAWK